MRSRSLTLFLLLTVFGAALPSVALARIKLITLPVRQRVEIQLDHPSATLVEEERIVPLVKGVNQVDFSWANTQIDPNTILFRVLPSGEDAVGGKDHDVPKGERVRPLDETPRKIPQAAAKAAPGAGAGSTMDVKVLSVSYPPNENALVWQVASNRSGSARVRISYLLGNLTKSFNYRAVADRDESVLTLAQYLRLQNLANEEFDSTGLWAGFGPRFLKPIGINESKQMLMEKFEQVPIKKTYTASPQQFGWLDKPKNKLMVPMHYVLKNDKANHLGRAPLQFGKVRIFQEDGRGSTAFLGEDWGKFTPLDDELRLYVGTAQDIVVVRTIDRNVQKRIAGNLYNRDVVVKYEIENFKDKAVTLDVSESVRALRNEVASDTGRDLQWKLGPDTTFAGGLDKEKSTYDEVVLHAKLPARGADTKAEKIVHKLHVIIENEW